MSLTAGVRRRHTSASTHTARSARAARTRRLGTQGDTRRRAAVPLGGHPGVGDDIDRRGRGGNGGWAGVEDYVIAGSDGRPYFERVTRRLARRPDEPRRPIVGKWLGVQFDDVISGYAGDTTGDVGNPVLPSAPVDDERVTPDVGLCAGCDRNGRCCRGGGERREATRREQAACHGADGNHAPELRHAYLPFPTRFPASGTPNNAVLRGSGHYHSTRLPSRERPRSRTLVSSPCSAA